MTTPNAPTNPAQAPDVGSPGDVAPDALDQLAGAGRAAHAATPALVTPGILAELDADPAPGLWPKSVATIDSVEQDALDLAEAATERLASSRLAIHRLEEEVRKLRGQPTVRWQSTCTWCCGEVCADVREPGARQKMLDHQATCEASPLVAELVRLRSDAEAYRWHQEQLASSDRRLADVENMRADLAARHVRQGEELALMCAERRMLVAEIERLKAEVRPIELAALHAKEDAVLASEEAARLLTACQSLHRAWRKGRGVRTVMQDAINAGYDRTSEVLKERDLLEAHRARWCKRAVDAEQLVSQGKQTISLLNREVTEANLQLDLHAKDTEALNALEAIVAEIWSALGIQPGASMILPACVTALKERCDKAEKSAACFDEDRRSERARADAATAALAECAEAMRIWGSWEDGVPASDELGEYGRVGKAYDEACRLTGKVVDAARPHRPAPETGGFGEPLNAHEYPEVPEAKFKVGVLVETVGPDGRIAMGEVTRNRKTETGVLVDFKQPGPTGLLYTAEEDSLRAYMPF